MIPQPVGFSFVNLRLLSQAKAIFIGVILRRGFSPDEEPACRQAGLAFRPVHGEILRFAQNANPGPNEH
jgi:hypothetical protein